MDFAPSARSDALRVELIEFDEDIVRPAQPIYRGQREDSGDPHFPPPVMEELKVEARKRGLWNMFMPEGEYGIQLSNLDYAPLCEVMGGSPLLSEATNCSAPDTGNMEILAQFGTQLQRDQWLQPLLEGEIRSCFAMTEPWVASSDALNISSRIVRDGDDYRIHGHKWFTSGALDPRCKVAVFMGVTDPDADPYHRQSMILVPMDAPGVTVARGLPVFGHSEGGGHGETVWDDVRVPKENLLGEEGSGFAIAQARLGPGRIHHCMRADRSRGAGTRAHVSARATRVAFGKPLADQGVVRERIAESRIADRASPPADAQGGVDDGHGRQETGPHRDRGHQGRGGAVRDGGDRSRHPVVRRRGCDRRLAARVDVRARAHPAPRRRPRRGAHASDRPQRARQVRRRAGRGILSMFGART